MPTCCIDLFAEQQQLKILHTKEQVSEPVYLVSKRYSSLAARYDIIIKHIEMVLPKFG
jgi:hypothetical protein